MSISRNHIYFTFNLNCASIITAPGIADPKIHVKLIPEIIIFGKPQLIIPDLISSSSPNIHIWARNLFSPPVIFIGKCMNIIVQDKQRFPRHPEQRRDACPGIAYVDVAERYRIFDVRSQIQDAEPFFDKPVLQLVI